MYGKCVKLEPTSFEYHRFFIFHELVTNLRINHLKLFENFLILRFI